MASAALSEAGAVQPRNKGNFKYAFTCALCASMATIVLGYDVGVMSGASLYIKRDLQITDVQLEIMMGILSVYALIGSFLGARTSDWVGRRVTVVFAAAIFTTGSLLMGFAVNYAMLMVGRFVTGIGVGYAIMVAPVYTAEVSPASARGFLTSFTEVFINVGILLGYVSNYAFARLPLHLSWRVMLGIGAVPSALLALMVFGMPESPRWLVMKGRLADARAVLAKTSDTPEEAVERLDQIKAAAGIPRDLDGDVVVMHKTKGGQEKQVPWAIGLCIVSILAYVSFFSIGLGPLTSVYTSEVFPLRVRALGFALGASCNRVTSAAVSMSFLSLSKAITIGGSFFLYAGIAAIGWIFFFTFIPETRGLPLEEIGKLFGMTDTAVEAQDTATKDKAKVVEMN
ncbi:Putative polyol transporter 1 [Triticum urartu]|uniref:Putative polyol transporter 1 n=1 Tax=Triticum urartu TaxID=4572 RepID=M7Z6G1_TRIUA|nr:Putative polyol transporter 1 [Triticum urartu]